MPSVLRIVKKGRWIREVSEYPWLAQGHLPADCLKDLVTEANSLSVWSIDDDQTNLGRVIAALAANREYPSNFDYALIDEKLLESIGIKFIHSSGDTPDEVVNTWHRDIVELSTRKIIALAEFISNESRIERIQEKKVRNLIVDSFRSEYIQRERIKIAQTDKIWDSLL